MIQSTLIIVHCLMSIAFSANWAVLIAGSNSYYNYRHQADISHAYQILTKVGGYPKENVITMMYNDIAFNSANPFPGQLFNYPNGSNVYEGVKIDYQGNDVNYTNFLAVLKGNASAVPEGKPVLKSTKHDRVFIYYSDHGATGIVAMPYGPPLTAQDLNDALNYMRKHEMYKDLVFYLEACESGSMFNNILKDNTDIYATTAANPDESSYAIFYNSTLGTYMADEYSIDWMLDTMEMWNASETLLQQYQDVKNTVKESHPQEYGDFSIENYTVKDFQSYKSITKKSNYVYIKDFDPHFTPKERVSSRNVKLFTLQHLYLDSKTIGNKIYYQKLIKKELNQRLQADILFERLIKFVTGSSDTKLVDDYLYGYPKKISDWECLKETYAMFDDKCMRFNDYSIQYARTLVHLCENYGNNKIIKKMQLLCAIN